MTKKSGDEKTADAMDEYSINAKDASRLLGINEQTIKRYAKADLINHARKGVGSKKKFWFRQSDIDSFRKELVEIVDTDGRTDQDSEALVDHETNQVIDDVFARNKKPFRGWVKADWDELYSFHGHGGQLTEDGVLAAAEEINALRDMRTKFEVVARSEHASTLKLFLDSLYSKVRMTPKPKQ